MKKFLKWLLDIWPEKTTEKHTFEIELPIGFKVDKVTRTPDNKQIIIHFKL